jgi:hypothetical protein
MKRVTSGELASTQAVTRVNAEQASKSLMQEPTRLRTGEGVPFFWNDIYLIENK